MKRASCVGKAPNKRVEPDALDPWFPGKGQSLNPGKMVCFTCPVRAECADYQNRTETTHGMWAGKIVKKEKDSGEDDGDGDA